MNTVNKPRYLAFIEPLKRELDSVAGVK
jgi:hypothetical protein